MAQDDDELVVPGPERDRELGRSRPLGDLPAVHEEGPGAHGPQFQARAGRGSLEPKRRRERDLGGRSEVRVPPVTDPPGTRERVGQARPEGQGRPEDDEESDREGEEEARTPPDGR
jgi:hypothetical protein